MLGQILATFILVVIGVNLVPSVANTTYDITHNETGGLSSNVTGAGATLIDLVPLFFIIGLLITTVQASVAVLAQMGIN